MGLFSWVGPAAMAASAGFVYVYNHPSPEAAAAATPISTTSYCGILFLIYATGIIPSNPLFPKWFFQSNIFPLMYNLYCSEMVGYRLLRGVMHQPAQYPHSDYRVGIRCLSNEVNVRCRPTHPLAAARGGATNKMVRAFFDRGGGVVDLALLKKSATSGVLIVPVPMFADNYAYLIVSLKTQKVAVVDPADPAMVLYILEVLRKKLEAPLMLTEVLTTHKHWDHAGGNQTLRDMADSEENKQKAAANDGSLVVSPELNIIGSDVDRPMACNTLIQQGASPFPVAGGGAMVQALLAPGHTKGSLLFVVGDALAPKAEDAAAEASSVNRIAVFTGDCIFCGGCGAMFETSSVKQVQQSRRCFLDDARIALHPATHARIPDDDVLMYVGHEYTERLVTEVSGIMHKELGKGEADPSATRYARMLRETAEAVKILRRETNGLEDAAAMGEAPSNASGGPPLKHFSLPFCTVPSSLAVEKEVNPLLTLREEVLEGLVAREAAGTMSSAALERAIYCSDKRSNV